MARHGIITIHSEGKTRRTELFFRRMKQRKFVECLDYFGRMGVAALAMETPIDTAETAASWDYEIEEKDGSITLTWTNSSTAGGVPVVILIQYGHGTRNGGYVQPYDFINPVTREIFNDIADTVWKEVTRK